MPGHPIFAAVYDPLVGIAERRGLAAMREEVVGRAEGVVLELGAGTGHNLGHYTNATPWSAPSSSARSTTRAGR